jgi:hypothetical protein
MVWVLTLPRPQARLTRRRRACSLRFTTIRAAANHLRDAGLLAEL